MRLNKTQEEVMRQVFGFYDGNSDRGVGISCGPQSMPVLEGSRQYQFGLELQRIGLANVTKDVKFPNIFRIDKV